MNLTAAQLEACVGSPIADNYSDARHQLVADANVGAFLAKFRRLYSGGDVSVFYGGAP